MIGNKSIPLQVYSVLFREDRTNRLELVLSLAYSLEEVFDNFIQTKRTSIELWRPYLWHSVPVSHIINIMNGDRPSTILGNIPVKEAQEKPIENLIIKKQRRTKNDLMREIVDKKDRGLLELYRHKFNEKELKYIEDKLK